MQLYVFVHEMIILHLCVERIDENKTDLISETDGSGHSASDTVPSEEGTYSVSL